MITVTSRKGVGAALGALGLVAVVGCGGARSSGPPKTLSLSGDRIPATRVIGAVSQMCGVATQSRTDVAGATRAFYGGPEPGIAVLATVLGKDHASASHMLLGALATYEDDLNRNPPPATTGQAADNLLQAARQDLPLLKLSAPAC